MPWPEVEAPSPVTLPSRRRAPELSWTSSSMATSSSSKQRCSCDSSRRERARAMLPSARARRESAVRSPSLRGAWSAGSECDSPLTASTSACWLPRWSSGVCSALTSPVSARRQVLTSGSMEPSASAEKPSGVITWQAADSTTSDSSNSSARTRLSQPRATAACTTRSIALELSRSTRSKSARTSCRRCTRASGARSSLSRRSTSSRCSRVRRRRTRSVRCATFSPPVWGRDSLTIRTRVKRSISAPSGAVCLLMSLPCAPRLNRSASALDSSRPASSSCTMRNISTRARGPSFSSSSASRSTLALAMLSAVRARS